MRDVHTTSTQAFSILHDALEECDSEKESIIIKGWDGSGITQWEIIEAQDTSNPSPTLPYVSVMTGTIHVGMSSRTVRLEVSQASLDHIGTFYHISRFFSTNTQCFFTGAHAIHANRTTLTQKGGELWKPTDWKLGKLHEHLLQKYRERGYQLAPKSEDATLLYLAHKTSSLSRKGLA
jgi:hypothetical protein